LGAFLLCSQGRSCSLFLAVLLVVGGILLALVIPFDPKSESETE
jgi:hypothetical protein